MLQAISDMASGFARTGSGFPAGRAPYLAWMQRMTSRWWKIAQGPLAKVEPRCQRGNIVVDDEVEQVRLPQQMHRFVIDRHDAEIDEVAQGLVSVMPTTKSYRCRAAIIARAPRDETKDAALSPAPVGNSPPGSMPDWLIQFPYTYRDDNPPLQAQVALRAPYGHCSLEDCDDGDILLARSAGKFSVRTVINRRRQNSYRRADWPISEGSAPKNAVAQQPPPTTVCTLRYVPTSTRPGDTCEADGNWADTAGITDTLIVSGHDRTTSMSVSRHPSTRASIALSRTSDRAACMAFKLRFRRFCNAALARMAWFLLG